MFQFRYFAIYKPCQVEGKDREDGKTEERVFPSKDKLKYQIRK